MGSDGDGGCSCVLHRTSRDNMQMVLEKIRADKKLLVAENMSLLRLKAKPSGRSIPVSG